MPRRERDWEIARRRKRKKEMKKLRAKGLLPSPAQTVKSEAPKAEAPKETVKKKPEKTPPKEVSPETSKPEVPIEGKGLSTPES